MECILDSSIGHSNEQAEQYLLELLKNESYREALVLELEDAFSDPQVSWVKWFSEYCVEDANLSEEELRAYIRAELYDKAIAVQSAT
ncbi:MAG TPA: hypothetical protein PK129_17640 [Cellvibrionaceae bacterium]|nr:hypothetical protein [Cellvibrionaceae bacterium]